MVNNFEGFTQARKAQGRKSSRSRARLVATTKTEEEATEEVMRDNRVKRRKRRAKREAVSLDKAEQEMRMHFAWLIIKESEHEKRMRDRALTLARKRGKQIGWVI